MINIITTKGDDVRDELGPWPLSIIQHSFGRTESLRARISDFGV